ncbi:TraB/VirB10 family protein [Rickettsia tamurae]|uniref:Conjugal transfer pilus assembly protein TraB n=1 Tax=Rickettsia tamurae subsp. buchneri TaxID=1462938 RepID=A0A8E1C0F9_9RICK|nr:TraB/VirB10 family protein [Rickettsia tamurae]KDO03245.1 conjugal transfer pilus assembly protein TraB [Rickettsia tamurae subsp. buchneri]
MDQEEQKDTAGSKHSVTTSTLYSKYSKFINVRLQLLELIDRVKTKPITYLAALGIIITLIFYYFSDSNEQNQLIEEERTTRKEISGIEKAVDPRAKWTDEVLKEVRTIKQQLETVIENKYLENQLKIDDVNQKLELLEHNVNDKSLLYDALPLDFQKQSLMQEEIATKSTSPVSVTREFGYVKRTNSKIKKEVKDYITTGSFARGVLLTGVVVGTGTNNAASPEPIMIRLVDTSNFSKGYKTKQIKEAILIGSCSGDISSERAKCRLETVSLINNKGDIIEKKVEGWLIGEDGRPGIKGIIVDKSSNVARMAVLNGVLGGIAQFFQNQATNGIFPISPMTGQQNALKAQDALKAGVYSGTGNALEKLADFAIKRAESMSPVIVVGSGRVVDVVFRKGFDLIDSGEEQQLIAYGGNFTQQENYRNHQNNNHYPSGSNRINSFGNNNFSKTNQKLRERFLKDDENWQHQLDEESTTNNNILEQEGGF